MPCCDCGLFKYSSTRNFSVISATITYNFSQISSQRVLKIFLNLTKMSKKVVLTLDLHDEKDKQKAMKAVSSLPGLESLSMNTKDKKLTVIGDIDPVQVVAKLRKSWHTEIVTVGPAKEPEKKKDDKDSGNKGDPKKEEEKKMAELWKQQMNFNNNPYYTPQHINYSAEENPNSSCVIC